MRPHTVLASRIGRTEATPIEDLLDLLKWRPAWHADTACKEHPEVSWFPQQEDGGQDAKTICAGCLALNECGAWARAQSSALDGVWGGLDSQQRAAALRRRKRRAA